MKEFLVVTLLTLLRIILWLCLVPLLIVASPLLTIIFLVSLWQMTDDLFKRCLWRDK
jgi:uncharacterized membrane protein YqhA